MTDQTRDNQQPTSQLPQYKDHQRCSTHRVAGLFMNVTPRSALPRYHEKRNLHGCRWKNDGSTKLFLNSTPYSVPSYFTIDVSGHFFCWVTQLKLMYLNCQRRATSEIYRLTVVSVIWLKPVQLLMPSRKRLSWTDLTLILLVATENVAVWPTAATCRHRKLARWRLEIPKLTPGKTGIRLTTYWPTLMLIDAVCWLQDGTRAQSVVWMHVTVCSGASLEAVMHAGYLPKASATLILPATIFHCRLVARATEVASMVHRWRWLLPTRSRRCHWHKLAEVARCWWLVLPCVAVGKWLATTRALTTVTLRLGRECRPLYLKAFVEVVGVLKLRLIWMVQRLLVVWTHLHIVYNESNKPLR